MAREYTADFDVEVDDQTITISITLALMPGQCDIENIEIIDPDTSQPTGQDLTAAQWATVQDQVVTMALDDIAYNDHLAEQWYQPAE